MRRLTQSTTTETLKDSRVSDHLLDETVTIGLSPAPRDANFPGLECPYLKWYPVRNTPIRATG